jgi:hypothetical protein
MMQTEKEQAHIQHASLSQHEQKGEPQTRAGAGTYARTGTESRTDRMPGGGGGSPRQRGQGACIEVAGGHQRRVEARELREAPQHPPLVRLPLLPRSSNGAA